MHNSEQPDINLYFVTECINSLCYITFIYTTNLYYNLEYYKAYILFLPPSPPQYERIGKGHGHAEKWNERGWPRN